MNTPSLPRPVGSTAVHNQKLRVVAIIDDDAKCRRAMAVLLERMGCKCHAYDSVRAFIQDHGLRKADCIILDFAMPEIDGLMAYRALRETNFTGPVIFCSGYSEEEIRERALDLGAACFLRKPISKASLLKAIRRVFHDDVADA